jgi:hypothetical protein
MTPETVPIAGGLPIPPGQVTRLIIDLQITEELEHQINIFPEDWAAGHKKPLRHDYRIITSKLPPKNDPAGGVTMMMDKTMWAACVVTSEDRQPQRQRIDRVGHIQKRKYE